MMKEQVYSQAVLLAGNLDGNQRALLKVLCSAAASSLELRLREGLTPQDCGADFVAAASLLAVAALNSGQEERVEEFKAGDLSVKQGATVKQSASRSMERQAMQVMAPYLKDRFAFLGV